MVTFPMATGDWGTINSIDFTTDPISLTSSFVFFPNQRVTVLRGDTLRMPLSFDSRSASDIMGVQRGVREEVPIYGLVSTFQQASWQAAVAGITHATLGGTTVPIDDPQLRRLILIHLGLHPEDLDAMGWSTHIGSNAKDHYLLFDMDGNPRRATVSISKNFDDMGEIQVFPPTVWEHLMSDDD